MPQDFFPLDLDFGNGRNLSGSSFLEERLQKSSLILQTSIGPSPSAFSRPFHDARPMPIVGRNEIVNSLLSKADMQGNGFCGSGINSGVKNYQPFLHSSETNGLLHPLHYFFDSQVRNYLSQLAHRRPLLKVQGQHIILLIETQLGMRHRKSTHPL